jgi:ribonuclease R
MTTDTLETLKQQILQFFAKYPRQYFKPIEISKRLSLDSAEDYQLLLKALHVLEEEQLIGKARRKRYGHTVPRSSQLTGTITLTKQGSGIVQLDEPNEGKVLIQPKFLSTALPGDTVSIAVFGHAPADKGNAFNLPESAEGEIVEILERGNNPIVGVFRKSKHFFAVIPDDNRLGVDVLIPKNATKGARPGEKVVAVIDEWESRHQNPEGHIEEVLGRSGEVHAEMASVARQFQLPSSFPKNVMQETDRIDETISKEEIKKRLDLRKEICFTIDPEDAKDFDDAVSLKSIDDDTYELGVHIADVSHYVTENSALDGEAYRRGTSVYLADEVVPMLPEKLSNNICSLRPNVDRLTYSIIMIISAKGIVKDYKISKTVIHSKRRFTYEEVQQVIERGKGDFAGTVKEMHTLSQTLLKKRMREGSIDFDSAETKFRFDEDGKPAEIIKKERLDSHRLVEEFMLIANQTAAKHIALVKEEQNVRPYIYRIHDLPDPQKMKDLAEFVQHLGYSLPLQGGTTSKAFQKLLNDIRGKEEENVINEVAIRAMAKAIYSEKNIGHFGLGFKYYTHFTSPIRRYPDLIVHRLLHEYEKKITQKRREQLIDLLPDICKQSSDRERVAMEAERESVKVMRVEYMKRHVGDEFHAIISGVMRFGLFVEIVDLLVEGFIRVRDMEDDFYVFDEKHYSLIGRRTKKRYRLGDKVEVKVVRVDPEEREIDFALVERRRD